MNEISKDLLKQVFFGTSKKITEITKQFLPDERKNVFKELKPIIKELNSICRFDPNSSLLMRNGIFGSISYEPKYKSIKEIYILIKDDLDNLKILHEEKININSSAGAFKFFTNLQVLYIGLSDYKSISSALKYSRKDPFPKDHDIDMPTYIFGKALLERDEEWVKEVFINFFENIEKLFITWGFPGFTKLVLEVVKKHPEWKNEFEKYIGKSMNLDGFIRSQSFKDFTPEIILSGLNYEFNSEVPQNIHTFQIQYGYSKITELIHEGYLPKNEIIKITLEKLLRNSKSGIITGWMKIYNFLNLSQKEFEDNKKIFLNMVNATSPQVISIALDGLKRIPDLGEELEYLIPLLAFNLNNDVQKVSKESFIFLKYIAKKDKKYLPQIIENIINNLAIHNKNLRTEIIKWISEKNIPESLETNIKDLLETDGITPFEKDLLKEFISEKDKPQSEVNEETGTLPNEKTPVIVLKNDLKDNIYRANAINLSSILFEYIKTKTISEIVPIKPDFSNFIYDEKIKYCENEIDLSVLISELVPKQITSQDLEIVIEGILKFREIQEKEKITKIIDPALKILEKVNIVNPEFFFSRSITANSILLAQLAYSWINNGKPFSFSPKTISEIIGWKSNSDMFCYKKFLELENIFKNYSRYEFLSTPVYKTGWIPAEVFAGIYTSISDKYISPDDLILGLFRLSHTGRSEAWGILKNILKSDNFYDVAVSIAISPEKESLHKSVKYFIDFFSKNPPDDLIFEMNFLEEIKVNEKKENILFRIFNAAIRSRFRFSNAFEDLPELKDLNFSCLTIDLGTDYEKYTSEFNKHINVEKINETISTIGNTVSSFFENLLSGLTGNIQEKEENIDKKSNELNNTGIFNAINYSDIMKGCRNISSVGKLKKDAQALIKNIIFDPNNFEIKETQKQNINAFLPQIFEKDHPDNIIYIPNIASIKENTSYYPNLIPFFFGHTSMAYYSPFNLQSVVFRFPPSVQLFFDTTIKREDIENCQDFIAVGLNPYVDIRKGLEKIGQFLILKSVKNKEKVLEIIIEGTKDGRLTFYDVSDLLKKLFTETSKGFKYLMESVNYLISYANYFEMIVIFSIENILAESKEENYSKNLSQLMELLTDLLIKNKRSLENNGALKFLLSVSESKKKSVLKDKAKILLSFENKNNNPIIIEILSEILKDTQQ